MPRTVLASIVPAGVSVCELDGGAAVDPLFPAEAASVTRAVERRRQEFAGGRTCARRALAKLGLEPSPILSGPNREPVWPQGIVGSITHCEGYRAAVVAFASSLRTIGIDAEIDEPLPADTLRMVATPEEQAWLAWQEGPAHRDKLLFCAKESIYKAWFPVEKTWLDFHDVVVTFGEDATFRARLREGTNDLLLSFRGRYAVQDGLIVTTIVV
jgi:4'-phosphopantetheinyl transferase EntD